MKSLFLLCLVFLIVYVNAGTRMAVDEGSAFVIDSKLSYMYNLRYSSNSKKFWFRADKSNPNVFYFQDKDVNGFQLTDTSPLGKASSPFLGFDVVSHKGVDYLIGSTYGYNTEKPLVGLPLQISASDGTGSAEPVNFENLFLYTPTIDATSLKEDGSVRFYIAGWKHSVNKEKAGFVLIQGRAVLGKTTNTITIDETNDVLYLNKICYDIFNEGSKPHVYIKDQNVIVAVPGHCNGFYKVPIPTGVTPFASQKFQKLKVTDAEQGIVGTVFSPKTSTIYYAEKNYNSAQVTIKSFNTETMKIGDTSQALSTNETNPVLAIDEENSILYIATAGFDHIYKWKDNGKSFTQEGIATLPRSLNQVSSMLFNNGNLYLTTNEPDAKVGKIASYMFCESFCGRNAYCSDSKTNLCSCATGFALPPEEHQTSECAPEHEVNIIITTMNEEILTYVFMILFVITLIGGIIGWIMWWRVRSVEYSSLINNE